MTFTVEVQDRNFSPLVDIQNNYTLVPERYAWDAHGGPDQATLRVEAPLNRIMGVRRWIGLPVIIYNDYNTPVWWGLIVSTTVDDTIMTRTYDMRDMANKVAVAYTDISEACLMQGFPVQTDWLSDPISIERYGTLELIVSIGRASAERALADRYNALNDRRLPIFASEQSGSAQPSATIECRGWHWLLEKRYYYNPSSLDVLTTEQIRNVIRLNGEQIIATDIADSSNIKSDGFRDGKNTALSVIEELLDTGRLVGDTYSRLLASVTKERIFRVFAEPARPDVVVLSSGTKVMRGGKLYNPAGTIDEEGICPVGVWVDDADYAEIVPVGSEFYPRFMFIEESSYDVLNKRLSWRNRDQPDPFGRGGLWKEG